MSTADKANNKVEELKGKAKEAVGRATGDEEKVDEGRADQATGDVKQAGEKLKDATRDIIDP